MARPPKMALDTFGQDIDESPVERAADFADLVQKKVTEAFDELVGVGELELSDQAKAYFKAMHREMRSVFLIEYAADHEERTMDYEALRSATKNVSREARKRAYEEWRTMWRATKQV